MSRRPLGMSAAFLDVLFLMLVAFMVNQGRDTTPVPADVPDPVKVGTPAATQPLPRLTIEAAGSGVEVSVNGAPITGDLLLAVAPWKGQTLSLIVIPGADYGPTVEVIERLKGAGFVLARGEPPASSVSADGTPNPARQHLRGQL